MLRRVLSIAGKPGLYLLVSRGNNMLIVENMETKERRPAYAHDRVVSLNDISIYTTESDMPLKDVLSAIEQHAEGQTIAPKDIRATFGEIVPNYDPARVHTSDIKKIFSWYNRLVQNGYKDFSKAAEDSTAEAEASESK